MIKKVVSVSLLTLLLMSMSALASNIQPPKASGTIYIRSDGTIEGTDKILRNGTIYTFRDTITDSIVLEKSDIVLDGAGQILEGHTTGIGIDLTRVHNVTVRNVTIKTFETGISLTESSFCSITQTFVTMSYGLGILLNRSINVNVVGNDISFNKDFGVFLWVANNSYVAENDIISNSGGVGIQESYNNTLDGNNVTANADFGLGLLVSHNNSFSRNTIARHTNNLLLWWSSNNSFSRNVIAQSTGSPSEGIEVYNCTNNSFSGNNVTSNYDGILVIQSSRNNVFSGNTITGNNNDGVYLLECSDNRFSKNTITANKKEGIESHANATGNSFSENTIATNKYHGILLAETSNNNSLSGNSVTENYYGIGLLASHNNSLSGNTIVANENCGIAFYDSTSNICFRNNLADNSLGLRMSNSPSNFIYHNNILNNTIQATSDSPNTWDDGTSGNFWSDYEGTGEPYIIFEANQDRYPLKTPLGPFPMFYDQERYDCLVSSNMTVSRFDLNKSKTFSFKMIGSGWVNVTLPRAFLDGSFQVFIGDTQTPWLSSWNSTYTSIYFECKTAGSNSVRIEAQVKLQGDINGDGVVNIMDIFQVAKSFGNRLNP
jgi:parallel beta-helix repeat protein